MIHVEGLLHLSGLAAAVSIVYAGLDRIHLEEDRFFDNLATIEKDIGERLLRYGISVNSLTRSRFKFFPLFCLRLKLYALCHVAGARIKMGFWGRTWHFIHRQRYAPLLPLFKRRWEGIIVRGMAAAALAIFIYTAAIATWELTWFPWPACSYHPFFDYDVCALIFNLPLEAVIPVLYAISAIVLVWVCITGAAAQRLNSIKKRCDALIDKVDDGVDNLRNLVNGFPKK